MPKVQHTSNRAASQKLWRAASLLARAGAQLSAASKASQHRHNRNRLNHLALDLRELSLPLSRIASLLERGGGQ